MTRLILFIFLLLPLVIYPKFAFAQDSSSCNVSYLITPVSPVPNSNVSVEVSTNSSPHLNCVVLYNDGQASSCVIGDEPGKYNCTVNSGDVGQHTLQLKFGQSTNYPDIEDCGQPVACNSDTYQTTSLSNLVISNIQIQPPQINAIDNKSIGISALAYDSNNNPIWSGISYEWGISSNNGIGSLSPLNDTITNFIPSRSGIGDIFVRARYGEEILVKSIPVRVTLPSPSPSPSCMRSRGDANCDGRINLVDFNTWYGAYFSQTDTENGDFNGDGRVSLADFEVWRANFYY